MVDPHLLKLAEIVESAGVATQCMASNPEAATSEDPDLQPAAPREASDDEDEPTRAEKAADEKKEAKKSAKVQRKKLKKEEEANIPGKKKRQLALHTSE